MGGVGDSGLVGFVAFGINQVVQRYAGRVPRIGALLKDGEPFSANGWAASARARAVSRSCRSWATVCSNQVPPADLTSRSTAPGTSSNSVIAAASVRLSCPLARASMAVFDCETA